MSDDVRTVAYAWVLDGIGTIFVTDEVLDDAWAIAAGFDRAHPGLQLPTALPATVNLRQLLPESTSATLQVQDVDGTMPTIFGANRRDADELVFTMDASEDPAPASTWGKHVGLERIGPAGERRVFSCVPGFDVGHEHLGENEAFANGFDPTPVFERPILMVGRRCAVYRVELIAGAWQTLAQAKRVWWGSMRGNGSQHLGRWSFQCLGPESWVGGNLAVGNYQDEIRCVPDIELEPAQLLLRASLIVRSMASGVALLPVVHHQYSLQLTNDTYLVGATSYADVAAALNLFFDDIIADISNGLPYNHNGNDIRYSTAKGNDGVIIQWRRGPTKPDDGDPYVQDGDGAFLAALLSVDAHEKVWSALGYDVRLQNSDRDPVENEDQYGQFKKGLAGPGYWNGQFLSVSPEGMAVWESGDFFVVVSPDAFSSGGFDRRWPPLYPNGAVTFTGQPGQEFILRSVDPVLLSGSKSRPVMADPADSTLAYTLSNGAGVANRQAVLVLQGPYRRRGDEEQVDPAEGFGVVTARERLEGRTVQVARVAYRVLADGTISVDNDSWPRLVVYEWLNPRDYGFDYQRIDGTWGAFADPPPEAEGITARPLAVWDYTSEGDRVSNVLQRLLLTTGQAGGWYAEPGLITPIFGLGNPEAYLDVGSNDAGASVPGDAEYAGLGLGVPASMVAAPSSWAYMDTVLGGELGRAKVVVYGIGNAGVMAKRLLGPTGFALGFSGGTYAPFDAWAFPTPDESALTITPELYARSPNAAPESTYPRQQLRKWGPIDVLDLNARIEPLAGDYATTLERKASDPGARTRHSQQIRHIVNADYLVMQSTSSNGSNWLAPLTVRWRDGFAFWGSDHTVLPLTLHMADALDVWPGDGVTITDPTVLSSVGAYGVSLAVGRVIGRTPNLAAETITITVLMSTESDFRMYAPSAVVTRYDEQDLGPDFRLLCADDHLDDRGGEAFDVDGFAEPVWSVEGGLADIEVYQFDTTVNGWTGGVYGVVASVSGVPGSSTITLTGPLTGAPWKSDRFSVVVLRPFAAQGAAWVLRWFAAISGKDGTHSGGTTGEKWRL